MAGVAKVSKYGKASGSWRVICNVWLSDEWVEVWVGQTCFLQCAMSHCWLGERLKCLIVGWEEVVVWYIKVEALVNVRQQMFIWCHVSELNACCQRLSFFLQQF